MKKHPAERIISKKEILSKQPSPITQVIQTINKQSTEVLNLLDENVYLQAISKFKDEKKLNLYRHELLMEYIVNMIFEYIKNLDQKTDINYEKIKKDCIDLLDLPIPLSKTQEKLLKNAIETLLNKKDDIDLYITKTAEMLGVPTNDKDDLIDLININQVLKKHFLSEICSHSEKLDISKIEIQKDHRFPWCIVIVFKTSNQYETFRSMSVGQCEKLVGHFSFKDYSKQATNVSDQERLKLIYGSMIFICDEDEDEKEREKIRIHEARHAIFEHIFAKERKKEINMKKNIKGDIEYSDDVYYEIVIDEIIAYLEEGVYMYNPRILLGLSHCKISFFEKAPESQIRKDLQKLLFVLRRCEILGIPSQQISMHIFTTTEKTFKSIIEKLHILYDEKQIKALHLSEFFVKKLFSSEKEYNYNNIDKFKRYFFDQIEYAKLQVNEYYKDDISIEEKMRFEKWLEQCDKLLCNIRYIQEASLPLSEDFRFYFSNRNDLESLNYQLEIILESIHKIINLSRLIKHWGEDLSNKIQQSLKQGNFDINTFKQDIETLINSEISKMEKQSDYEKSFKEKITREPDLLMKLFILQQKQNEKLDRIPKFDDDLDDPFVFCPNTKEYQGFFTKKYQEMTFDDYKEILKKISEINNNNVTPFVLIDILVQTNSSNTVAVIYKFNTSKHVREVAKRELKVLDHSGIIYEDLRKLEE